MKNFTKGIISFVLMFVLIFALVGCDGISTSNIKTYTIAGLSNNSNYGTVYGGGNYAEGETVTLVAVAKDGYEFQKWDDNSTDISKRIVVSESKSYTAIFVESQSSGISISVPFKTEYIYGESLNTNNGLLEVKQNNIKSYVAINSSMISNFDTNSTGSKKLILTYDGYQILVDYTVSYPYTVGARYFSYNSTERVYGLTYFKIVGNKIRYYYDSNVMFASPENFDDWADHTSTEYNLKYEYNANGEFKYVYYDVNSDRFNLTFSADIVQVGSDVYKLVDVSQLKYFPLAGEYASSIETSRDNSNVRFTLLNTGEISNLRLYFYYNSTYYTRNEITSSSPRKIYGFMITETETVYMFKAGIQELIMRDGKLHERYVTISNPDMLLYKIAIRVGAANAVSASIYPDGYDMETFFTDSFSLYQN